MDRRTEPRAPPGMWDLLAPATGSQSLSCHQGVVLGFGEVITAGGSSPHSTQTSGLACDVFSLLQTHGCHQILVPSSSPELSWAPQLPDRGLATLTALFSGVFSIFPIFNEGNEPGSPQEEFRSQGNLPWIKQDELLEHWAWQGDSSPL